MGRKGSDDGLPSRCSSRRLYSPDPVRHGDDRGRTASELVPRTGWTHSSLCWPRPALSSGGACIPSHGQKGGKKEETFQGIPAPTEEVRAFLSEKPSSSPWDFLVDQEIAAFGPEVKEIDLQKKWGRAIFFGSNLRWCWLNAKSITDLMYGHLQAKPGDRALVVGEFLEEMGFLPELRKKVSETGEIVAFDMMEKSRSGREPQWKTGSTASVPEKHRWDYPFADTYPDQYFDLDLVSSRGSPRHSWDKIAPRLLRALKPGGQILMAECRVPPPEFHLGIDVSGMLQCIVDKIFWGMEMTLEEMPDYSTADLSRAFGDRLTDIYSSRMERIPALLGIQKEGRNMRNYFKKSVTIRSDRSRLHPSLCRRRVFTGSLSQQAGQFYRSLSSGRIDGSWVQTVDKRDGETSRTTDRRRQ